MLLSVSFSFWKCAKINESHENSFVSFCGAKTDISLMQLLCVQKQISANSKQQKIMTAVYQKWTELKLIL